MTRAPPRRPPSPKLGNFSDVFSLLDIPASPEPGPDGGGEHVVEVVRSADQPLELPSVTLFFPVESGLLGGLDISAVIPSDSHESPLAASTTTDSDATLCSPKTIQEAPSTQLSTPNTTPNSALVGQLPERLLCGDDYMLPLRLQAQPDFIYSYLVVPNNPKADKLAAHRFYAYIESRGADPKVVTPRYLADEVGKVALLEARLYQLYRQDLAVRPSRARPKGDSLHIFVDLSNIIIGFANHLKHNRFIDEDTFMKMPPLFFKGLKQILERGRPTARRILAGSTPNKDDPTTWPAAMHQARDCGYEMNILSRIVRTAVKEWRRPGYQSAGGAMSTDHQSSDDNARPGPPRNAEQGVDEILQLKMCHSFLDHTPGVMVLATGDANEAEFSDGFLKHVERALERNWRVELVAWRRNISVSWRKLQRDLRWRKQFQVIELDDFVDELHGIFL
jgi:hypothetical protein